MRRRCGLEGVGGMKIKFRRSWFGMSGQDWNWFGRSEWDDYMVWKEWAGQRYGLGGTERWFGRSGWDKEVIW